MPHNQSMDQETINEARIIDAVSWIVKASAQLRIVGLDTEALDKQARILYMQRKALAQRPSQEPIDGHEAMVQHAILNAYGHALYSGSIHCGEIEEICNRLIRRI